MLDEIQEPIVNENLIDLSNHATKEKRRYLRIFLGKCFLIVGLIGLVIIFIGAGVYAKSLNEWFTAWGKYGTALFKTWMIVPLILSFSITIIGIIILYLEFLREDE